MVSVLTQMLAEVDPIHPNGRQVIASIVKPLEQISKLALKVGKPGEKESG
jgi:E3 ubiquitin-protein ligase HUWE1